MDVVILYEQVDDQHFSFQDRAHVLTHCGHYLIMVLESIYAASRTTCSDQAARTAFFLASESLSLFSMPNRLS